MKGLNMINQIFFFIAGTITFIWGIAHLFPTKSIVKGFGEISIDNRNIVAMEWIIEGIALIFIGAIVIGSAVINSNDHLAVFNYLSSAFVLFILAIISLFTGYKVNYLPFKLCPFLFSSSAILIILGLVL
jgi:hypothetical protein